MRARIDGLKCQGQGRCYGIAPAFFTPDDIGQGLVENPDVPPELEATVRRAAAACPERAITIEEHNEEKDF
jgi:ferredoxin